MRRISEESGQSLILIALTMTVALAVAAFSIDAASWMQHHHRAQVVADSAALAAANCLANPGTTPNGMNIDGTATTAPACTSSTDTTDATTVAEDYAKANGVPITAGQIAFDTSTNHVTINTSTTSPSFFARFFGIQSTTQTAAAQAHWAEGSTACTTALEQAGQCYAIYAANQTCGTSDGWVTSSASLTITGAIHSQGSLNISNGSFNLNGPINYSTGNCGYTAQQNATMTGSDSPTAGGNQAAGYWPLNYATVFPACSSTGAYQCTGPNGTPSYCAAASYSFSWAQNSSPPTGIYCAYGSGNPGDPTTWTGAFSFNSASWGSSSSPVALTMIGGYVTGTSSKVYLEPAANADNCLVYALDPDSADGGAAYIWQNGNSYDTGAVFAPNGTINLNSTYTTSGFLEAQNVDTSNLSYSFTGDGPVSQGTSTPGSDLLTQ
jgi:hypothetical protein